MKFKPIIERSMKYLVRGEDYHRDEPYKHLIGPAATLILLEVWLSCPLGGIIALGTYARPAGTPLELDLPTGRLSQDFKSVIEVQCREISAVSGLSARKHGDQAPLRRHEASMRDIVYRRRHAQRGANLVASATVAGRMDG
jgi:hypothetical protein